MQLNQRNQLIADHLHIAATIAHRCVGEFNLDPLIPFADILGYAQQGLVEAAARYSPQSGTPFTTFSWTRIRGAVVDGLRKSGRIGWSRRLAKTGAEGGAEAQLSLSSNHRNDTVEQLDDDHVDDACVPPETSVDASRLRTAVLRAINELSPRERDVTLRHYYKGEGFLEISKDSHLSRKYLSRLHTRCLKRIQAALGDGAREYLEPESAQ